MNSTDARQEHINIFKSVMESDQYEYYAEQNEENQQHALGIVWTEEELSAFNQKGYVAPEVPLVLPKLHTITSLYNENIAEMAVKPATSDEIDNLFVDITNMVLRSIQDESDFTETDKKVLDAAMIYMLSGFELSIKSEYSNPFNKYICIEKIPDGGWFFDPQARADDQCDWSYFGYHTWVDYYQAIADYPKYAGQLDKRYKDMLAWDKNPGVFGKFALSWNRIKQWGNFTDDIASLIDVEGKKLRRVVLYRRQYRKLYHLKVQFKVATPRMMDMTVGQTVTSQPMDMFDINIQEYYESFESASARKEAEDQIPEKANEFLQEFPDSSVTVEVDKLETNERYWHKTVTIGEILVEDEEIFYPSYPIAFYSPKIINGTPITPLVSGIKVEKQFNRWWTFADRFMWESSKNPLFIDVGKLSEQDAQNMTDNIAQWGQVFRFDSTGDNNFDIRRYVMRFGMDQINPQIFDQGQRALSLLEDVFAVPPVRMGKQQYAEIPAKAQELQDQNAKAVQTPWFEPMKKTKINLATAIIERIPDVYSVEQIKKIVGLNLEPYVSDEYFKWLREWRYNVTVTERAKVDTKSEREFGIIMGLMESPVFSQVMMSNPDTMRKLIETAPIPADLKKSYIDGLASMPPVTGQGQQPQPQGATNVV